MNQETGSLHSNKMTHVYVSNDIQVLLSGNVQ